MKYASRVIGMAGEQLGKLRDRCVDLPLVRIFHRQSVAGKNIGRILGQDLFECRDFVHNYRARAKALRPLALLAPSQRSLRNSPFP